MGEITKPVSLAPHHNTKAFSSGNEGLDSWLTNIALQAGYSNTSRTYVVSDSDSPNQVIGFYSISSASLTKMDSLDRIKGGTGRNDIPAVLLARLAVDKDFQNKGIGKALVRDAVLRVLRLQVELGIRVLLVHAIDEEAKKFYEQFGFKSSPVKPLLLMALLKDVEKLPTG